MADNDDDDDDIKCLNCGHSYKEHDDCYDFDAEPWCYHEGCDCEWMVWLEVK